MTWKHPRDTAWCLVSERTRKTARAVKRCQISCESRLSVSTHLRECTASPSCKMPLKKQVADDQPTSVPACKHTCKHKDACGHLCCKRYLSPIVQLKSAQRLSSEPASTTFECKHTCSNKLSCGHHCCKRHLSREAPLGSRKQQPAVNLELVTQGTRKPPRHTSCQGVSQVRRASSGPVLGVQGKSVRVDEDPQARSSSDATPSYHFLIYDIESTGASARAVLSVYQL